MASRIQTDSAQFDNVTDFSKAFTSNVTSGSLVVVSSARWRSGDSTLYVAGDLTKSAGTATIDTPVLAFSVSAGSSQVVGVWSAKVTASGSLTLQVTHPGSGCYGSQFMREYGGSWDGTRTEDSATDTGSATNPSSGDATSAGAALFVGAMCDADGGTPTITEDAAFTLIAEDESGADRIVHSAIDRIVATGTTDAASWTTAEASWAAGVVVFKEAAGDTTLAAAAAVALTSSAALTTAIQMATSTALTLTSSASLTTSITMASAATVSITSSADLTAAITMASSQTLALTTTSALTTAIELAGAATAAITTTADLTAGAYEAPTITYVTTITSSGGSNPMTHTMDSTGYTHVLLGGDTGNTTLTASDNKSSTFEALTGEADVNLNFAQLHWAKIGTPGSSHTVELLMGTALNFSRMSVFLVNSPTGELTLDAESADNGTGTAVDAGSLATSAGAVSILHAGFTAGGTQTPASGWDEHFEGGSYVASRRDTASGTFDPACTRDSSSDWAAVSASWITAAGDTSALASTPAVALSTTAALTTAIEMAATSTSSVTVGGALTTEIVLASTPAVALTTTAALDTATTLASSVSVALTTSAALTTAITMAGASAVAVTTTANLVGDATVASAVTLVITTTAAIKGAVTIASITGTVTHGSTITISGADFGAKGGTNANKPLIWADFESDINPSSLGHITSWDANQNLTRNTGGTQYGVSGANVVGTRSSGVQSFSFQLVHTFTKLYACCKRRWSDWSDPVPNYKHFRLWNDVGTSIDYATSLSDGITHADEFTTQDNRFQGSQPTPDVWRMEEVRWKQATENFTSPTRGNGTWEHKVNGVVNQDLVNYLATNLTAEYGQGNGLRVWDNFDTNEDLANGTEVFMDDFYIDDTWARVMIGDASTLATSTVLEVQIPSAWSDTSITCTLNLGSFTSGTVYAYVVDADNRVNAVGYELTIGETGALAAASTLSITSSAALTTAIELGAASAVSIVGTSALTTAITLDSDPTVVLTTTAGLTTTIELGSAGTLSVTSVAGLTTSITLASGSLVAITTTSALAVAHELASATTLVVTVTGDLNVPPVVLSGMLVEVEGLVVQIVVTSAVRPAALESPVRQRSVQGLSL